MEFIEIKLVNESFFTIGGDVIIYSSFNYSSKKF